MKGTLVLNATFEPLSVVSTHRALTLLTQGKVVALDESPVFFNSENGRINVPYVALHKNNVKRPINLKTTSWSRHGVLVRDGFTCAYCGAPANTIDHVWPVSKGGKSTYQNCVAACFPCNQKKRNKTLKEIGWELKFDPTVPSVYESILNRARGDNEVFEIWNKYVSYYMPAKKLVSAN